MIDIHNAKLTKPQWSFLELVNRTPMHNQLGWKLMSPQVAKLFHELDIPKDLIFHKKMAKAGYVSETEEFVYLSDIGRALIKYGACAR